MQFPIALQLYSIREDLERDFAGTLRQVKALGYDGVEFAGVYGQTPAQIRQLLQANDLVPLSAHVPFTDLVANPQQVIAEYAAIGCQYIVIPYLTPEYRPGAEKFAEVIAGAKVIGQAAHEAGLILLYHNHDFEFIRINGEYALDVLYEAVPADLLQTEIDTCWVNVAGENPAAYLRQYTGRAPVVHLKDFVMPGKKPAQLYELIGLAETVQYAEADVFEFRPLGQGVQDIPEILAAAAAAGTQWVVVEQDMPSMQKTPLECAAISIAFLQQL